MTLEVTKRVIPAQEEEHVASVTCDLCGHKFEDAKTSLDGVEWPIL